MEVKLKENKFLVVVGKNVFFSLLTSNPHIVTPSKTKKEEKKTTKVFFVSDGTEIFFFLYFRDAKYVFVFCNCLLDNYIFSY